MKELAHNSRDNTAFMFGRYRLSRPKQIIAEHFETNPFNNDSEPRNTIVLAQPISNPPRGISLVSYCFSALA